MKCWPGGPSRPFDAFFCDYEQRKLPGETTFLPGAIFHGVCVCTDKIISSEMEERPLTFPSPDLLVVILKMLKNHPY